MKTFHVCLVVLVTIQAVLSCGPVASERKTFDELDSNAALNSAESNEGKEELSMPVNENDATTSAVKKLSGNEPNQAILSILPTLKHHKHLHSHKRNHKPKKHHGKRHHHKKHHRHQHHHRSASAEANLPNPSPAFHLSAQTAEPWDFLEEYAQITSASSMDSQFVSTAVYRYAGADKASDDSQIKTAKINSVNPSPTPTVTPVSKLATTSLQQNQSVSESPTKSPGEKDPCAVWENCDLNQGENATRWIQALPSCPCQIQPLQLIYNNTIYDQPLNKFFRWRQMRVDKRFILRRTAEFCIRSFSGTSFTAQVCCYDFKLKLITRGIGAGTPLLVSPDWNNQAHYEVDILPILICNGDWTRYHAVRPPNNGLNCSVNPDDSEFALQQIKARDY